MSLDVNSTSFMANVTHFLRQLKNDGPLKDHQFMVKEYIKQHNGLLVQHDLGTGKSLIAAAVLADAISEEMPVLFISNKTLSTNMINAIKQYEDMANIEVPVKYKFITMNASNMLEQVSKASTEFDVGDIKLDNKYKTLSKINLDGKCLIIDEAHNLFNSITNGSENAIGLYNAIMKSKRSRVLFLSGTPIVNHPFELVPCFNMIAKREVLPTQWNDFNNFFVDTIQQSIKNKSKFQNRISGLLSYYGAYYSKDKDTNREDFPKGLPIEFIKVPMSSYQYNLYRIAREREINESNIKNDTGNTLVKPKGLFNSSYKRLSRQWSNFAFPKDALTIGKQVQLFSDEVDDADIKNLAMYSPKWKRMIEQLNKDHGKSLVYSSFVENAGISMFARALINHGWEEYDSKSKSNKSFIIITGDVVPEDRYDLIDKFNSKSNILGNEIKLIMISGAGAEGIDLNCVQNVHIMEPYWNWMRISQVRGRAIRYKSHIMLPLAERIVNTYIYLSDYPEKLDKQDDIKKFEEFSTDNTLLATSIKMNKINNAFYQAMAESSIDCVINNKNSQLKCRLCAPTNEMLYINDIYKDMSIRSPCRMPKTKDTEATEVLLDGKKYAYIKGDIYTILEYREDLEGYVELDPNSVLYGIIREELK